MDAAGGIAGDNGPAVGRDSAAMDLENSLNALPCIIHGIYPHPYPLPEGEGFRRLSLWERPREARVRVSGETL